MTLSLLYSNSADRKYPLSDFHEEDIPNDILLDLSLNVPAGYEPVVGAIRITQYMAFVSIENRSDGMPLAVAAVPSPQQARVYPLTMDVPGHGWIVFGPGIVRDFYSEAISVELDPETFVQLAALTPQFSLVVNTFDYAIESFLAFLAANDQITLSVENNTIYIDRNDSVLTDVQIAAFTETSETFRNQNVAQTIAGVSPDENGNIDIDISSEACFDNCDDTYSLEVPRGDTGDGAGTTLPLDIYAEARNWQPGDPCRGSEPGASEDAGTFDGCQFIEKITILDPTDDHEIGTLYTTFGGSSS